jgi:TP901 family phage tail tape measure protein
MVDFRINVIINPVPAVAGAKKVDAALTRTTAKAGLLGGALVRALAPIATGAFLVSGVKTLANFGQAMSTVAAITQSTGDEFNALREEAIALGRDTRFSATEAADGMTFLARAGFDANEVLAAIGPTLNLAVAGNLDLARAADISSNVLKGFRLPVSEMARVLDVMALAANSSNTNVSQLGDAMKFVAPIASGVGVSVEETTAAIGALSDAGLQASLAGTGLRKVLGELEAPSDKSKAIFKELGVAFEDVQVSEVGLTAALKRLKEGGVSTANALELFGQRGGPAFEVLVNSIPGIEELKGKLDEAGGSAEKMAEIMDDNLLGALRRVRSAFQTLIIRLGDSGATGVLRNAFESLAQGMRFLAENLSVLVNAIQGIVFVVAVQQIRNLTVALKGLALAAAANPLGALAVSITFITGALIAFRDEITLTNESTTTLADVARAAFDEMKSILDSFVPLIKEVGQQINDIFGGAFDGFELNLQNVLLALASFGDASIGIMLGLGNSLVALFTGIPKAVGSGIFVVLQSINNFIEKVLDVSSALFNAIGTTASNLGLGLLNFFREIDLALTQLAQGQLSAAKETAEGAKDLLTGQLGGIGKSFMTKFRGEIRAGELDRTIEEIVNPFEGAGGDMAANMTKGFEDGIAFSGITDFVLKTFTAADAAAAQREALAAQEEAQAAANAETAKAVELQALLAEGTDEATVSIGSMSESLSGGFRAGLENGLAAATDVSGAMESTMVNAFGAAEDALVSFVTTGEADFSALVDGILADLTRLLARQALLALINSFTGGAAGGGGAAGIANLRGGRAEGGPVRPGEPVMVGERGPELFVPPGAGSIATAAATAAAGGGGGNTVVQAPPVNVSVVNVTDPKEVVSAINSPEGEQMILNVIQKNRSTVKNNLAG